MNAVPLPLFSGAAATSAPPSAVTRGVPATLAESTLPALEAPPTAFARLLGAVPGDAAAVDAGAPTPGVIAMPSTATATPGTPVLSTTSPTTQPASVPAALALPFTALPAEAIEATASTDGAREAGPTAATLRASRGATPAADVVPAAGVRAADAPPPGLVEHAVERRADPAPWPPPGLESLFPEVVVAVSPVVVQPVSPLPFAASLPSVPAAAGDSAAAALAHAPAFSVTESARPVPPSLPAAAGDTAVAALARAPSFASSVAEPVRPATPGQAAVSSDAVIEQASVALPAAPLIAAVQAALANAPTEDAEETFTLDTIDALADGARDDAATPLSAPSPTTRTAEPPSGLAAPVALVSPRFAEEIGARVRWQAEQNMGEAVIRISPDGLGPVEVRLRLDGERVDVGFLAPHGETRQALESALPRLKELLQQGGLQLGQSFVGGGHGEASRDQPATANAGWPERFADMPDTAAALENPPIRRWQPRSLLDAYA